MKWKLLSSSGVFGAAICSCAAKNLLSNDEKKVEDVRDVASDSETEPHNTLILKQSQVFFRHGARTPINTIPKIEEATYPHDILMNRVPHTVFDMAVEDLATGGVKPESFLDNHYTRKKLKGGCIAGQLTTLGQDQCYLLGKKLRQDYIENTNLLSEDYNSRTVFGRSTNIKRTIESLRCVLAGMFGADNLRKVAPVKVYVSDTRQESLHPNTHFCHVLAQNNHSVIFHLDTKPYYLPHRRTIEKAFHINFKDYTGVTFVSIRDDLVARKAHGLPVPPEALPVWDTIEVMASKMMYCTFCGQHQAERDIVMRLATGPLMTMVLDNIQDIEKNNENAKKLYLFSTHDSTLIAILGLLDVFDDTWPPFAADLRFELYENPSKDLFIQVLYMGKPLKVRGCDSTMCSLEQFRKAMKPYLIRDKEFKSICSSDILEKIDKEIKEEEEGEIQTDEIRERSETPAGM